MKRHVRNSHLVLAALAAVWLWSAESTALAEEVNYSFNFGDGMVPDDLTVWKWPYDDEVTETLTLDASSGQLRFYDTVPASCGIELDLDPVLTDTHISAEIYDQQSNSYLMVRQSGGNDDFTGYGCWLWRIPETNKFQLHVDKYYNGKTLISRSSTFFYEPVPCVMQLDVVDGETTEGVEYTDVTARLTYNAGQDSRVVNIHDIGILGERVASGQAAFGAQLGPHQRDVGWTLDVTYDNVTISGTLVPEPTTLALLLSGVAGALLLVRRRRV